MAIQLKIGDVVHVRGTVVEMLGREVGLDVGNTVGGVPHYFWIPSGCVVHVEPAPLKVGDGVKCRGDAGVILAIDRTHPNGNPQVWIRKYSDNGALIAYLDDLERTDEPCPLKVGDKVRHVRGANTGTIIAIGTLDGITIIRWDCGMGDALERTDNLERVE